MPTQPTAYSYFCRAVRLRRGLGGARHEDVHAHRATAGERGAQRVVQMIADYTKLRVAFGKPTGSYHRVEDKCSDIENAKLLTYYAAWAIDGKQPNAPLAVWMADAGHKVSNIGSSCIAASA